MSDLKKKNKQHETSILEEVIQEKKQTKRGRKVKVVDFKKVNTSSLNNFVLEETIILHLPVTLNEIIENTLNSKNGIENILTQEPISPIPYNSIGYNLSENKNFIKKEKKPIENISKNIYMSVNDQGRQITTTVYSKPILPTDSTTKDIIVSAQKTDVACWWCCHKFDTYPVCAPIKYDEKKDIFKVIGCFCSFNCAKSYSMHTDKKRCISYNAFLYKKIVGKLEYIKPAPPKTVLEMFGGPISIEEYRSTFNTLSTINVSKYPMIFYQNEVVYNKIDNSSLKSYRNSKTAIDKQNIDISIKRISTKKSPLIKNNLLNIMGIKVKDN